VHTLSYLGRHLRKGTLLRNKYRKPWSNVAHNTRRLIRAYVFVAHVLLKKTYLIFYRFQRSVKPKYYRKKCEKADLERQFVPFIRYLFADDVTFWHKNMVTVSNVTCSYHILALCHNKKKNYMYFCKNILAPTHYLFVIILRTHFISIPFWRNEAHYCCKVLHVWLSKPWSDA